MPRKKDKGPFQDFKADENTLIESGIGKNVFTQHSTRSAAASRVKKQKNKKTVEQILQTGGRRYYKTFLQHYHEPIKHFHFMHAVL